MTLDKIWETFLVVLGGIISGGIGLLAGWLLNKWQRESERTAGMESRRCYFLAFLKKWRTEIFTPSDEKIGGRYDLPAASVSAFQNDLSSFNFQAVLVQNDFPDRQRFNSLTERISGLKSENWNKKQPRDVICEAIDALINFCSESVSGR